MSATPFALTGPTVIIKHASLPDELQARIRHYNPKTDLGVLVKRAIKLLPRDVAAELLDTIQRSVVMQSQLRVIAIHGDRSRTPGRIDDYGIVSRKVVTNAGVDFLIASFANTTEPENLKYHGLGSGTTAEAATQTALTTEFTTEYNPDSTRATGVNTVNAGPNPDTLTSSGTNTFDATVAINEHGLFSAASAGTLWDRSYFGAGNTVNLVSGDQCRTDYTLTINAGG
jgi:hypothetical protein